MKPVIIQSYLLKRFAQLVHGISTKIGPMNGFNFNLGNFSNANVNKIESNRDIFFRTLGINKDKVVFQQQIHSDKFSFVDKPGLIKENDALVTNQKNLFLVVTVADCIPILFFDTLNEIIGVVHSGWRGTLNQILLKTVNYCKKEFNLSETHTYFYFGPSICFDCFEVDEDVAIQFDQKYVKPKEKKFIINLPEINLNFLLDSGFKKENIQVSSLCTYELSNLLHSYRRDKNNSGRMFGVIGLRQDEK